VESPQSCQCAVFPLARTFQGPTQYCRRRYEPSLATQIWSSLKGSQGAPPGPPSGQTPPDAEILVRAKPVPPFRTCPFLARRYWPVAPSQRCLIARALGAPLLIGLKPASDDFPTGFGKDRRRIARRPCNSDQRSSFAQHRPTPLARTASSAEQAFATPFVQYVPPRRISAVQDQRSAKLPGLIATRDRASFGSPAQCGKIAITPARYDEPADRGAWGRACSEG
jgi:hypothetical protein